MTSITEYYREECEKIDPSDINASFELKLGATNKSELILETSWNDTSVDLEPAIKKAETNTHLSLSPADNPVALQFDRERGEPDCINGDQLSRIISMTKLKDVNQDNAPKNGDVYIYENGEFKPFNLTEALKKLQGQIDIINNTIKKPEGIPDSAKICYGNINLYSDWTNSNNLTSGLYTHNPADKVTNDEFFS